MHAATIFPLGKAFLNALFATKAAIKLGQIGRLNLAAHSELAWWDLLLEHWPGSSVHQFLLLKQPDQHIFTDAAGSWGCGAWSAPYWFQVQCNSDWSLPMIALKELLSVVVAVAIWGNNYRGRVILCLCDNAAAVSQINWLHARDPQASHMLRCLAYLQALYDCRLRAVHIASPQNTGADHLSHNRVTSFCRLHPQASPTPSQVPPALVRQITQQAPDWTFFCWRETFKAF